MAALPMATRALYLASLFINIQRVPPTSMGGHTKQGVYLGVSPYTSHELGIPINAFAAQLKGRRLQQ